MYISATQIRQALTYAVLIPEIRKALIAFSAGQVTQPLRSILSVREYGGRYAAMSAVYGDIMGTKLVSVYPDNGLRRIPSHSSVIHLFSAETGQPLAMMDGDVITEMRTAAVSAIATELLCPADASRLAILGAGVQARAHAEALRGVRPFRSTRVWSRNPATAENFAAEIGSRAARTVSEAVRCADVIVTATSAREPILLGSQLQDRALIIAVGAVGAQLRELDDDAMRGALIVESRDSVYQESGDVIQSGAKVYAELGELLSGVKEIPRADRVVFKSVGIAVEDLAAARLVNAFYSSRPDRG